MFSFKTESASGYFPAVALQADTLEIAERVFFRNRHKILCHIFVRNVFSAYVKVSRKNHLKNVEFMRYYS